MRIKLLEQLVEKLSDINNMLWTLEATLVTIAALLIGILIFVSIVIRNLNDLKIPDTHYREMLASTIDDAKTVMALNNDLINTLKTVVVSDDLLNQLNQLNFHLQNTESNNTLPHLLAAIEQLELTIRGKG